MKRTNRHTMGQDWGGRRASNPAGIPRITARQVVKCAAEHGLVVKREGPGWSMWFVLRNGNWITLGDTNYLAIQQLKRLNG